MEYRQLGRSGLTVSAVGLGCNNFGMMIDGPASSVVVHEALDRGITFFDTADVYGGGQSEVFLGAALGPRRDDAVIATKFGWSHGRSAAEAGSSPGNVLRSCEESLRRLGTDHIDLYYQHVPDPSTPLEETLGALEDLVRDGKVLHVATSNPTGGLLAEAHDVANRRGLAGFVACQIEWNLLNRAVEGEIVPACRTLGLGVVPYYPLASGLLTGKHSRGAPFAADSRMNRPMFAQVATEENWDRVEQFEAVARDSGHTLLELALGWLLAHDTVSSVIAGATRAEQVAANVTAAACRLSADEVAMVAGPLASA